MTYEDSLNVTGSPASRAGQQLWLWQDGPATAKSGLEVAPANRSAQRASGKPRRTKDTSGPKCSGSSKSADPQPSWVSRLVQRMALRGSMEFSLTSKVSVTPAGRVICRLAASKRRSGDSGYGGWPTPTNQSADGGVYLTGDGRAFVTLQTAASTVPWSSPDHHHHGTMTPEKALSRVLAKRNNPDASQVNLDDVAALVPWCSPTAQDCSRGGLPARPTDTGIPLTQQVATVPWATPQHCDGRGATGPASKNVELGRQALGLITSLPIAAMATSGVLNAAHSRWLMGYPETWDRLSPGYRAWALIQKLLSGSSPSRAEIEQAVLEVTAMP